MLAQISNMFDAAPTMKKLTPKKSVETRALILSTALKLFRKNGYAATTMRDIGAETDLALGSAYYYFPSKEAIVLAYYERVQDEHAAKAATAMVGHDDLRERLGIAMHTKLNLLKRDRDLLAALFGVVANPASVLSIFGSNTTDVRTESIAIFELSLGKSPLSPDLRQLLVPTLWFLHMGFLLYFIHDTSSRQRKTRMLVDGTLDLVVPLIGLAGLPQAAFIRERLLALIRDVGSLPSVSS